MYVSSLLVHHNSSQIRTMLFGLQYLFGQINCNYIQIGLLILLGNNGLSSAIDQGRGSVAPAI